MKKYFEEWYLGLIEDERVFYYGNGLFLFSMSEEDHVLVSLDVIYREYDRRIEPEVEFSQYISDCGYQHLPDKTLAHMKNAFFAAMSCVGEEACGYDGPMDWALGEMLGELQGDTRKIVFDGEILDVEEEPRESNKAIEAEDEKMIQQSLKNTE